MSLKGVPINKRVPLLLMILTIMLMFLVPTVMAQPLKSSRDEVNELHTQPEFSMGFDAYFAIVNYNEPSSPWVLINYYYENGSFVRMVFGVDRTVYPSMNLNYQNGFIQVLDKKGKVAGLGLQMRSKPGLYVFVPV